MGNPVYKPRPKRWPQMSLKGVFALVTILCAFLGWLGVQVKWIHDRHESFRGPNGHLIGVDANDSNTAPPSIRLLGEPGFSQIFVFVADKELSTVQDRIAKRNAELLFPEAEIVCTDEPIGFSLVPLSKLHGSGFF